MQDKTWTTASFPTPPHFSLPPTFKSGQNRSALDRPRTGNQQIFNFLILSLNFFRCSKFWSALYKTNYILLRQTGCVCANRHIFKRTGLQKCARELFIGISRDIKFWLGLINWMFRSACGMLRPFRDHKNHLAYTLQRTNTKNLKQYSQKRNCFSTVPCSTFMCLWAIYIFPRWISPLCCRKYVYWSWEYINRSQTHECGNWAEVGIDTCK
jgi:hypothetical protein